MDILDIKYQDRNTLRERIFNELDNVRQNFIEECIIIIGQEKIIDLINGRKKIDKQT